MEYKYNGWSNYPTWAVNLWIGDSEDLIKELVSDSKDKYDLSLRLRDYVHEIVDSYNLSDLSGFIADLLGYSLDQIDFMELAGDYWDEYRNGDDEPDDDEPDEPDDEPDDGINL